MREVAADSIAKRIRKVCIDCAFELPLDVIEALQTAQKKEKSELGRYTLEQILKNAQIAEEDRIPLCQDTGVATFFAEVGTEIHVTGDGLWSAINRGMIQGYREGYLRKSMVIDPLNRVNSNNNSPPIVHYDLSAGDHLRIHFLAKGAGAENMSRLGMLKPQSGEEGIERFVLDTVRDAGAQPCPPIVVGIGLGGTFEKAAILAKKALFRPLGEKHPERTIEKLEMRLLDAINNLGIGPQGLGGITTALSVAIETYPCHMASLPIAVNINCHCVRRQTICF